MELMKQWKHKCELQLLVCEPNPLRPDRVTVGFVLRDLNPEDPRVEVKIASNLRAIRCIYPDADVDAISGALSELKPLLTEVTDLDKYLQHLPADFPAHFSFVPSTALLTESIEAELPLLERQYLLALRRSTTDAEMERVEHGQFGRAYIRRRMQEEFSPLLASGLMTSDINMSDYTFEGDRLKIDFGYWHKRDYRMMHATSVVTGLEQTAILAMKWRDIRKAVEGKIAGRCELMSLIEDPTFTQTAESQAAQRWLLEEGIEVRSVADISAVAQQISTDLRL
jgi:hypothetical protein